MNTQKDIAQSVKDIAQLVKEGKDEEIATCVKKALDDKVPPLEILKDGLLEGMNVVGDLYKDEEFFIPDVLMAAATMTAGLNEIRPYLSDEDAKAPGTVVIGTVYGDLHDIGKNIVKMLMEAKGLEVIDLGNDVPVDSFVSAAAEHKANIVCCSALITSTMCVMKDVVEALKEAGLSDVKVMVGGAPVTQKFCNDIGADKYTSEAGAAAEAAIEICSNLA